MTIQYGSNAVKALVYRLLNVDTGIHPLDGGDFNARHWHRNKTKSPADFENEPETILCFQRGESGTFTTYHVISVYHKLVKILGLDALCDEFNALPVKDWDSYEYYGVSLSGEQWLDEHQFERLGDTFNSENGDSCLSQIIQGETFKLNDNCYVLLQIHGGSDPRQGYTDAKLFRLGEEHQLYEENCSYPLGKAQTSIFYRNGEWFDNDGNEIDEATLHELIQPLVISGKQYVEGRLIIGGFK